MSSLYYAYQKKKKKIFMGLRGDSLRWREKDDPDIKVYITWQFLTELLKESSVCILES